MTLPAPGPIRAVGFDLDGTLFDHRGSAESAVTSFLTSLGVDPARAAVEAWFDAERTEFERWRAGHVDFAEQRRARIRTVLPPLGVAVPSDDDGIDALFARYLDAYRSAWRLFPDAADLLSELRSAGFRLGLLTNGTDKQQLDKLASTGIDRAFDAVCVSETIGFQKPDARAFHTMTRTLNVDPAACLFVGDDASADIAGARDAGLSAVHVDRAGGVTLRDTVVQCLSRTS